MRIPQHRRLQALVITGLILLSLALVTVETSLSIEDGGEIDLFTQKELYNGEGLNQSSDAFSLDEEVKVFALVTYYDWPEEGIFVAFQIFGPKNSVGNITFARAAITNETGVALISFRLPNFNETAFGEWTIIGNARVAGQTVQDTLSFKVGWGVEIISMKTVNGQDEYQGSFPRGSQLGVELTLRNIALSSKNATLTINLYDSMSVVFDAIEIIDLTIPSNTITVYRYYPMYIPESAHLGEATIYANAYTAPVSLGGIPYCPEAVVPFTITNFTHDVAVLDVKPQRSSVYVGENLTISVIVKNLGYFEESFNVTLFYYADSNPQTIDISLVENLEAKMNRTLLYRWNTKNVSAGNYTLCAYASEVDAEENLANNLLVDGSVEVIKRVHDVAVQDVNPSSTSVFTGDTVDIYVLVKNFGDYEESFNVTLFYDALTIGRLVVDLESGAEETVVFHWETGNVQEGSYILSAYASEVDAEENLENNLFVDGSISVMTRAELPLVSFLWLLPLLSLIIIPVVVWLYYRQKRREEAKKEFHSGWTAWYSRKPIS